MKTACTDIFWLDVITSWAVGRLEKFLLSEGRGEKSCLGNSDPVPCSRLNTGLIVYYRAHITLRFQKEIQVEQVIVCAHMRTTYACLRPGNLGSKMTYRKL